MRILVVIDMQNDFITGPLGTKEAEGIVDKVAEKIREHDYHQIFYTMDSHSYLEYPSSQESKTIPPHCIFGASGWELHPKIQNVLPPNARQYCKGQFASMHLARAIRNEVFTCEDVTIELVGLCTDICVIANAMMLKAILPEANITVDSSCCAGTTPEKHQAALDVMKSCQITVV